jgi:hypothetical protein
MKLLFSTLLLGVIWSLSICSASAEMGECSGILHVANGSVEFGGGKGEGEDICVVADSDKKKILSVCAAGKFCRVKGSVAPCADSGECTDLSGVVSVTRK